MTPRPASNGAGSDPGNDDGTIARLSAELDRERAARRALERSERLYRTMIDAQSDLIVRTDAENRILFANEAYLRTFGKTGAEVIGSSFAPLVHEDDLEETLATMRQLATPPHRCHVSQRAWTVRGWRWIAWDDQAVVDDAGSVIEVQGVGRDVTEQKEREDRLMRRQRSLHEAVTLARIGRWDLDHVSGRLHWSTPVYEIFEVDPDAFEPTFERFLSLVHPDDREVVRTAFESAVRDRRPYDIEHRIVTPDGAVKWLRELCEIEYADDERPLRSVGVVQDVSYRKLHDPLTGLANSLQLQDRLHGILAEARRAGESVAVCSLDVDRFADLNATLGRGSADRVLMELADRLERVLRDDDLVVRTGGDEFVLVLAGLQEPDEAHLVLARAIRALARPVRIDGDDLVLTASVGVALFPSDDEEPDTLKRHADQAMQLAKSQGRDRIVVFDADSERRERELAGRRWRLRDALTRGELEVHVQPTVALDDGSLCGVEALIRWRHPEEGLLAPGLFLGDVLGDDLEIELGRWVLDTVLAAWSDWRRAGVALAPLATVSVNVGAHQLLTPGFTDDVRAALERHPDVRPQELQLEVLESAALTDVGRARGVLASCRELGVQIALDDFGTGYSSLSYFRNLPIDTLKIDLSFVQGMLEDEGDHGIVESVIGLARAFDRHVVAEGVETLDHASALATLGADMAQGYAIARPMEASGYPAWAAAWSAEHRFGRIGGPDVPPAGPRGGEA